MTSIEEVSVPELRAALDAGILTVRQLVQACLDRIAAFDLQGPALHAVIELNPEALEIADRLDRELAVGEMRGPLHGIPVLLKDNIATADGMENTAGSLALVGAKPVKDAFVTTRLRDAGTVILGKTNLSEWANIRSSHSTSGWSGRGGQTRNPYQVDRNPSGSSSGSGVAVAASYVPLALGTETNGSIVSPSSANGIVGIKPTVGLVSRTGVIPISHSQDTVGPMARSVTDAAMLLTVLAVADPTDPANQRGSSTTGGPSFPERLPPNSSPIDYVSHLDADGLRGARIGVLRGTMGFNRSSDEVFSDALAVLAAAGAELVDPVEIPTRKAIESNSDTVELMLWELSPDLLAYFAEFVAPPFPIRTLADIVRFNNEHAAAELRYFDQDLFHRALEKSPLDDPAYLALAGSLQDMARAKGLDAVLDGNRLDAIVAPTAAPANKLDLIHGDTRLGGTSTVAAVAGYPLITLPAGYRFGMPVGITFMGRAWSEATLIRLAFAFEQASTPRRAPEYLPPTVLPPDA
jgi:amidase